MKLQIMDRISVRPFRVSDRDDLVAGINDWQVARWLASVPHPYRIDHANAYLAWPEHSEWSLATTDATARLALAVCADDRLVGGLSLVPAMRRPGLREFGFWLSRSVWGQGIMPRAVRAVIDEILEHAPYTGFAASANHDNVRSQNLIRALGFVADGQDEIFSNPLQRRVAVNCFRMRQDSVPT